MKTVFTLLIFLTLISSCKPAQYIQVYYTKGLDTEEVNNQHVFENDTVKITYSFIQKKGHMLFLIQNKLSVPIYIDWNKSEFSLNDDKLVYSHDYKGSKSEYKNPFYWSFMADMENKKMIKIERQKNELNIIRPESTYGTYKYYLLPSKYYKLDKDAEKEHVAHNEFPEKNTVVYFQNFSPDNSPYHLKHKLTFYFSEKFREEFSVENKFYVSKIKEMANNHFLFANKDEKGKPTGTYTMTHSLPTSFYIEIKRQDATKDHTK